jgi:hypothetical protein
MAETAQVNTYPLLEPDMFKKQLKNYYVLFSQQQSASKPPKKKKKSVLHDDDSDEDKPKTKKSKSASHEFKLQQFKVSRHTNVDGIIEFNHNTKKFALEFNVYNPKTNKTYREIIYLPIIVDLNEILNTIKGLKEDIYIKYSKGEESNDELSKDFDYFELNSLENELLDIIDKLQHQTTNKFNTELEAENELLIKYRMMQMELQTRLQTSIQSGLESGLNDVSEEIKLENYKKSMTEYLMVNQTLNHVNDENSNIIILPGTRVKLKEKYGIIVAIDHLSRVYDIKFDEDPIGHFVKVPIPKKISSEKDDLIILSSIRNSISDHKNEMLSNSIKLNILINLIENKDTLLDVLYDLHIDLTHAEIMNRPRLEIYSNIGTNLPKKISIIDKINTFYTDIVLSEIFNKTDNIIIGKNMKDKANNMDITLVNWRQLFSMDDMSIPFIIDDFEFNSITHYLVASQFYNREDLSTSLKIEYDNFFLKFTNNFKGLGSLSKIHTQLLNINIDNSVFKKSLFWSMNNLQGDSLESLYLKKAYYNKFNKNKDLREALVNTYPKIIYETVGQNKLLINYELMLVRYYLYNNITPFFDKFNYNPYIYKRFTSELPETKIYEYKLLLHVFLKYNAYDIREELFVDSDILHTEYNRLDISGKTNRQTLNTYFQELLFSYNSVFIYEFIHTYITNDTITHKSVDMCLKKYDLQQDESKWIFNFYYQYITSTLIIKEQIIHEDLLLEKELEQKYRALQTTLKAHNYIIAECAFRSEESFLDSIIEYLNRNKFEPFDVSYNIYPYSESSNYTNTLFNKKEFPIYAHANDHLYMLMTELFNLNNTDPAKSFDDTDYSERFEIISRLLALDILIISENANQEIKMEDTLDKYQKMFTGKIQTYDKARGRLVLGCIMDTNGSGYFFSTKPYFASEKREIITYLIANNNYVIEEDFSDNDKVIHTIVGKWDPIRLVLDITDKNPGDSLNGDIEIEDFLLYKLDDQTYYKDRELYF